MGGTDAVVAKARGYLDDGELRFAAQLLKHAVFADPDHPDATELRPRPSNGSAAVPRTAPGATST